VLIDVRILDKSEQLDLNSLVNTMLKLNERCGAITLFIGLVKGLVEGDKKVYELEYTIVKNAALKIMEKIAREEAEKYKLSHVVIWHRIGSLKPGEVTIVIAVLAENRKSSFAAAEEILERVKSEVPIFKLEKRSDGEYWVIGSELRVKREK
jgi:molybdopterin synthase catalytic subunit